MARAHTTENRTVLVTGGAGFIGSHTCLGLLDRGDRVVVVDDYSNSSPLALDRVAKVAGSPVHAVHRVDLRDHTALSAVLADHDIDAVVHFAAKKAVGESVSIPLEYYDINVSGTVTLLRCMVEHGVDDLVFSSSCSIYGAAEGAPLTEADAAAPTNPYARSKLMCEQVIADACVRYPSLRAVALRYFNPIGAHESGLLGEAPRGVPHNVMPYMAQVAVGRLPELEVFGDDYGTVDGTCVRDYVHVLDIADAHCLALDHLPSEPGLQVFNLGTGIGTSVLQLASAFSEACGSPIPLRIVGRRAGDVAALVADASKVASAWGWRTRRDLPAMCRDAWNFQQLNPAGYGD